MKTDNHDDQASETPSVWETFGHNVQQLLDATPARVDCGQLMRACRELGVPLAQMLSPDFDPDELPWVPNLEVMPPVDAAS